MKVIARSDDGVETDVTEGVQALYDQYMGTMDIGSGFVCLEEALVIYELAKACSFVQIEEIEKYVAYIRGKNQRPRK